MLKILRIHYSAKILSQHEGRWWQLYDMSGQSLQASIQTNAFHFAVLCRDVDEVTKDFDVAAV